MLNFKLFWFSFIIHSSYTAQVSFYVLKNSNPEKLQESYNTVKSFLFTTLQSFFTVRHLPIISHRACEVLQSSTVLNTSFEAHEAHITFIMQFFMDYNLHGMNFVHVKHFWARQKEGWSCWKCYLTEFIELLLLETE